ncbi:MAG TPA: phosphatase PAP2 family protein [Caulobacteraceae bacterium]
MTRPIPRPEKLLQRLWRFGQAELGVLAAMLVAAGGLLAFGAVADEMMEGEALDMRVLSLLRPTANPHDALGPRWFEHMVAELTTLGGTTLLTLFAVIAVGFLLIQRRRASALLLVVALGGGTVLSEAVKALFGRDRPPLAYRAVETMSASFPSGHAMLSTITYLTLGALLAQVMPKRRLKAYVFSVAVLLALIVGASRVYLGVHWLTDVLAGWSLGAAWAMICWLAAWTLRRFLRRHPSAITEAPVEGE